jgi:FGGY-family pentulose kinase
MQGLLVAVDVGTGSARAGVLTAQGRLLARREFPIVMNRSDANHAEHDSEQIWQAVCDAVRAAMADAGAAPADVRGLSFDATCSLVVRDAEGAPVTVSTNDGDRWDTVVWLDHRALAEAEECTATGHQVLDYIGGVMSPEMEVPKLMWLKRHLPASWARAGMMFDLADFLTWKATGSLARSKCTLATKWTYLAHEPEGWRTDFLQQVGLEDLLEKAALPHCASPIGADLGNLSAAAAEQLGLATACRVGAGVVDAYAGALAVLGPLAAHPSDMTHHCALIAGTSSCVMAMSPEGVATKGIWGPHLGTILEGYWQLEGGQSASGALLDHVVGWHPAGGEPDAERHRAICARVAELRTLHGSAFASRLHVLPDFHGNRSPLADPNALGVISGLTLDDDFDSLCRLYWRTCVGIALGIRHILETMNTGSYAIDTMHVIGGHIKNPLLMELYADAVGCRVVEPETPDATLLGTAMIAATAAGLYPSLEASCIAMQQGGRERRPDPAARQQFDRDYRIFLEMLAQRRVIDEMA